MNENTSRRDMLGVLGISSLTAAALSLNGLANAAHHEGSDHKHDHGDHDHSHGEGSAAKAIGEYVKPDLPYALDALEPHIDAGTMNLHSNKHHAGYTRKFNAALKSLEAARNSEDYANIRKLSGAVSFNGGGHFNHIIFFNGMTPKKTEPKGALLKTIERDFGSFDKFQAHLFNASKTVQGSGWGVLGYESVMGRLLIFQMENQQNQMVPGIVPLLMCDVWEHAYYKKYGNLRGDYIKAWMKVINWDFVSAHFDAVTKITH